MSKPELMYSGVDVHLCLADVEAVYCHTDHIVVAMAGSSLRIPGAEALDFMKRWYAVKEWQYSKTQGILKPRREEATSAWDRLFSFGSGK